MCLSARFFLCARCHRQVLLCRRCDRGQLYCGAACSKASRQEHHRQANRRYSTTYSARLKNAQRQQRYRQRQRSLDSQGLKKVTDQGSAVSTQRCTLGREPITQDIQSVVAHTVAGSNCFVCRARCSELVRHHFLLPLQRRRQPTRSKTRSPCHDH